MFSVDVKNSEETELCSSLGPSELVEVSHDELRLTMCEKVIFEFSKSGMLLCNFQLHEKGKEVEEKVCNVAVLRLQRVMEKNRGDME